MGNKDWLKEERRSQELDVFSGMAYHFSTLLVMQVAISFEILDNVPKIEIYLKTGNELK